MPRARLVLREKAIDEAGNIVETVIWVLPARPNSPAGIKYRFAFVRSGEKRPAVLYDNHTPKGDHRHLEGVQEPYRFTNIDQLLADFTADVRRILGDDEWSRR